MKPQPRPALAVKPSEHVAAPGREGPFVLSRSFYDISAGLPALARPQKPRCWVTLDKCPRVSPTDPRPALQLRLPNRPRESACGCQFQVKSSGKRHVPPTPKRLQDSSASSSRGSPGCIQFRTGPRPEMEGTPRKFGGMEIRVKVGRIRTFRPHPHSLPTSRPEDPAQQGNRGSVGRLGRDLGKPVQAARSGPVRSRSLDVSPRALEWQRPPGLSSDVVGRGAQGAVSTDLRALGLQELGRQYCPRVRAWVLGKPEERERVDAGAAARSRRPPAPRLDQFRAAVATEKGPGRRDALTNVAVNTSGCPGE